MSADWISGEECEAMDRARDPEWWADFDRGDGSVNPWLHTALGRFEARIVRLAAMRRAWQARPATAKADETCGSPVSTRSFRYMP